MELIAKEALKSNKVSLEERHTLRGLDPDTSPPSGQALMVEWPSKVM